MPSTSNFGIQSDSQAAIPSSALAERYGPLQFIGEGSFSTVYKGYDRDRACEVAIKVIRLRGGFERLLRVEQEVAALRALNHPRIIQVFDVIREPTTACVVTELISGRPLSEFIGQPRSLSSHQVVSLMIKIAEALIHVHDRGLIHRDLKPSNIIMCDAESDIKLLDFGLSWITSGRDHLSAKSTVGTLAYMAPEQTGVLDIPVDARADLYSFGVLFYEMLTGTRPFASSDPAALIHQHVAKLPPPPNVLNPDVQPILNEIVLKLLRKAPQDRYQTAAGLMKDLEKYEEAVCRREATIWFELGTSEPRKRLYSFHASLVGREHNLMEIRDAYRTAAAGRGQAVFLCGEPGIGKSRLVHELRGFVAGHGGIFISGKCTEYSAIFPYSPFVEAVEEYVRQVSQMPAVKRADIVDRIKKIIGTMGTDITRIFHSIKELIGEGPPLQTHDWEAEKDVERFLNVASDFLLALSSDVLPVAMFWDDLQWIDGGSLKLLERTMPKLKSSHLLFLGAYRDTHVGPEHPLTAFLSVWRNTVKEQKLHGLLDQDVETLLREVVTLPTHHTKEVARIVTENTAGNPFFILETVKALVQSDALAVHGERLTVEVLKTSGLTAASGVDQVILKRLRNLSPSARDILRCAAVIGRHFTFDVLVQLRQDGKLVLESIEEGIQKHIITQRDGTGLDRGYSFVHDKILETLYNEIEAVDRRYLHQQIGEALETLLQHDGKEAGHPLDIYSDASIFELALHFRLGEDTRKAMKYCLKAARLAQRTYANAEAVQSYEAVLKLLEARHPLPEEDTEGKSQEECTLTIRESLGDAYAMLGRYGNAEAKYLEIRPSFQHPEKALALCRLETKLGTVSFKQGDREKTLAHFGTALQALGITQPTTTFGVVLNLLTETCKQVFKRFIKPRPCTPTDIEAFRLFELLINYYYFIDMKRCFQVHMKHLNLAEQTASEAYCRVAYGLHQNLCNAAALHGRALKYAEKSMALMRSLEERNAPDAYGLAILDSSVSALGRAYFYTAQYDKAVHYLDAAGEETLKRGNFWDTEVAYGMLCMAYFGQGQFDSMLKCAKALHRIAEGVKDVRGLGWAYVLQALVYSHQGRLSEALDYARRAAKHTRKVGDQLIRIMSLRVLGQVYLKSGKINHAIRALELSRAVILKYQILHDFITGTFVILGEAYSEASAITPARRSHFLKRAGRALWIGRLLARLFPNWRSHALRASGSYELKRGREANALRFLHQSIAEAERLGSRYDEAMAKMLLGRALARKHDSQASVYLERAQTLMTEMGSLSELGEQGVAPLAATEGPRAQELPRYDQDTLKITREFESLLKVCQEISILQDVGNLLEHILEAATEVVCAERGYLLLNENGHLKVKIVKGLDVEEYHTEAFRFSRGLIDQVASSRKPILTTDAQIDPRLTEHKSIHRYGLRSILCVPLLRRNNLLGILYLDNRLLANLFNERHLELISAFAGQAAIAIENASSYHELELEKLKLESLTRSLDQTILEKTTDLRQTNEQLQEANARLQELDQAKTMFISVVSHELRTPLTSIRCYLDNLLAGIVGPLSEKQTYYIQRSAHNLDRLTVMVNDLLDLSRIESGHVHLHLAPLQVPDIVMDVVENLRPTAEAKRIRLEANHDGPPVMVNADRDKFHQVLNNLIGNALKFTPPEGTIEVRSQQDGNCVTFCVSDTGCGIAPEEISRIFERFYRCAGTSAEQRGAGLGLAICESLIKHQGGRIWVESVRGEGSRFYFTLPVAETTSN